MASTLPTTTDCCTPCGEGTVQVAVPGPAGADGAAGAAGAAGVNAFTTTTAQFVMPAEGANVTASVVDSTWMTATQVLYVGTAGYMEVQSKPTTTSVILKNLEDTASSLYTGNAAPATNIPNGSAVSPAGIQGPDGAVAAGALLSVNDLDDLTDFPTARTNLGLGSAAVVDTGVADTEVVRVDDAGGLVSGEAMFATAAGAETKAAAAARTVLGLGTAAVVDTGVADTKVLVVDDTGGLTTGQVVFSTASGLETVANITTLSRLVIPAAQRAFTLVRHVQTSGTDAGGFTTGSWQTVGLNEITYNTGSSGISTLAAGDLTVPAGVYIFEWLVTGYQVNRFASRLLNVTDGSNVMGSAAKSASTDACPAISVGSAYLVLGAAKDMRVQAQCETTKATDGFGIAHNFGTEVFAWLKVHRLADL